MTRGTLALRLAALPLTVILAAMTGAHTTARNAPTATLDDCAAFAAVYNREVAPMYGKLISGDKAISIMTDLANATQGTDPPSATVRADAQRVIADLENYDGPAAERDAVTLEADASKLLAHCGHTPPTRTA
jgi:hypothetical protein